MYMEYYLSVTHTEKLRKRRRAVHLRLCGKGSRAEPGTPAQLHKSMLQWFWNISLHGHKESSEPVLGILLCLGLSFPVPDLMCTSLFCLCCGGMWLTPLLYLLLAVVLCLEHKKSVLRPSPYIGGRVEPSGHKGPMLTIDADLALSFL